jgi:hypothetical protein
MHVLPCVLQRHQPTIAEGCCCKLCHCIYGEVVVEQLGCNLWNTNKQCVLIPDNCKPTTSISSVDNIACVNAGMLLA